ncbi:MAG: hypothetical protein II956_14980 [Bacteroidales bacterium]|nr:hypothetical protein [Bacteroidales bacterium]
MWDDEKEKWYFAVVDVVEVLTDSKNPTDYIKKMKSRDTQLAKGWGQIVTPLPVNTAGGRNKILSLWHLHTDITQNLAKVTMV